MLDQLAIQIWRDDPHRPDDGVFGGRGAGRARALREFVRGALESAVAGADANGKRWRPAAPLEAMADFWKREVCWRQSAGFPCVAPVAPRKEPKHR